MITVAVITVSDSAVAGTRQDLSGPALRERAESFGWTVSAHRTGARRTAQIADAVRRLADSGEVSVVLTTGGTGVALRDVTPEATRGVIEREIPGLGELMRAEGLKFTPMAVLSRGLAGVRRTHADRESAGVARRAQSSLWMQSRNWFLTCWIFWKGGLVIRDQTSERCATLESCATR